MSLHDEIEALGPWFHNLHLPGGAETAPDHALGDFPKVKWEQVAPSLPQDLSGWTALDIGCNAGFYSFELARRGADVVGLDVDEHYLAQARWAADRFGLGDRVRFERGQIYDLSSWKREFDLVLFLGVFYHLRYPLLGLDLVAERVGRRLVFQTMAMPGPAPTADVDGVGLHNRERLAQPGWPAMAFIEGELAGDPTNWWAPNPAAAEALLRAAGMRIVARPGHEIYVCEPDRARGMAKEARDQYQAVVAPGRREEPSR